MNGAYGVVLPEAPAISPSLDQAEAALDELIKAPRFGNQNAPLDTLRIFLETLRAKASEPIGHSLSFFRSKDLEVATQAGYSFLDDGGGLLIVGREDFFAHLDEALE